MQELKDLNALVTGCSGGIGAAICRKLTEAGASVIGVDMHAARDAAANVAAGLAEYRQLDVSSEEQWRDFAADLSRSHDRLDILVHNAGIVIPKPLAEMEFADFRKMGSVNVDALFLGTKATLDLLRKGGAHRHHGASMITVASVAALGTAPLHVGYCTSKGAAKLFSKSCAVEFSAFKYNIRSNAILPGGVDTPMMDHICQKFADFGLVANAEEARRNTIAAHPAGRMAIPEDIAKAARFLASDEASFVHGTELIVDGGFTAI